MEDQELIDAILKTNAVVENPVEENLLKQILAIVMLNPFNEDRGKSQEQLKFLLNQKLREFKKNENK